MTKCKGRLGTTLLVNAAVLLGILLHSIFIALIGVGVGLVFLWIMRRRTTEVIIDERVQAIGDKAARVTFTYITLVLGLTSIILMVLSQGSELPFTESLGLVFAYITMMLLLVYTFTYKYYNRAYGAEDNK
ncbi:MAG: DUF2178 domain-containing protein [Candidatus Kerfeldbacteria bacterium]